MRVKDSPSQYENIELLGKEMDTYKVGTVANSCSTMHKIAMTPITREHCSFDMENRDLSILRTYDIPNKFRPEGHHLDKLQYSYTFDEMTEAWTEICEGYRRKYNETKDPRYWRALIQLLPASWNQKRTWTTNYQVLRAIYFARKNHKLTEWRQFCDMILNLPYGQEIITYKKEDKTDGTNS